MSTYLEMRIVITLYGHTINLVKKKPQEQRERS